MHAIPLPGVPSQDRRTTASKNDRQADGNRSLASKTAIHNTVSIVNSEGGTALRRTGAAAHGQASSQPLHVTLSGVRQRNRRYGMQPYMTV
jgi:hypothetical protein